MKRKKKDIKTIVVVRRDRKVLKQKKRRSTEQKY